jgi:branched-chain amino acid transport system substrate-binding protein
MTSKSAIASGGLLAGLILASGLAFAGGQYGPGVSDSEIKLGNTMAYSGPASSYGTIGRAEAAYFAMINEQGGINGRRINFISRDDGYSPPKTVEMVRQLVEHEGVLALFQTLGTPPNNAIRDYLNDNKVPQLFVGTGATKWNFSKIFPCTMGFQPIYHIEARIYARYILKNVPDAKIAMLYQNDDSGKDYLTGLRDGLGDKADKLIVATQSYETSDATVDSQILALRASGANVMLTHAIPKFAAQAIRKIYDIDWKPMHILANVAASVKLTMEPAGVYKGVGIISSAYVKDPTDPQWRDTPEFRDWVAWMQKYYPSGSLADGANVYGYSVAQTMVAVLKQCGNNLTRENLMKQAADIHDLKLPMLIPGITVSTSATDFAPIKQLELSKFN